MDSEEKKEKERYFTKFAQEIEVSGKIISEINKLREKRGLKGLKLGKEIKERSPIKISGLKLGNEYPFDLSNSKIHTV